jgi:heat shock protein HslJ
MNKKTLTTIFVGIVLILVGVIIWQYKSSKSIVSDSVAPVVNNITNETADKSEDKVTTVEKPAEVFKKVTVPAKDTEALRSKFTYEVPLSKIIDRKWQWIESVNYDETIFTPKKSSAFSLTFKKDGTFSGTTDCNSIFGKYTVKGSSMELSSIGQTMMYCDGSEEIKFTTYLGQVSEFMWNGDEDLILNLEFDSGSMVFK